MDFREYAEQIEQETGEIVDHFHAYDESNQETIIYRVRDHEGLRYIDSHGLSYDLIDFIWFRQDMFHGYRHEPLWQRSVHEEVSDKPEPWWVRLWKRAVSW